MLRGLVIALTCLAAFAPAAHASQSALLPGGDVVLYAHYADVDTSVPADPDAPEVIGLTRLGPDGTPRAGFGRNGFELVEYSPDFDPGTHPALAVDGAGRILLAEQLPSSVIIQVYTADGQWQKVVDVFPGEGFVLRDMIAIPGGLLVAGSLGGRLEVLRLTADLELDPAFGDDGIAVVPDADCGDTCHVRTTAGREILAGGTDAVAKLTSDGSLDDDFGVVELPRHGVIGADEEGVAVVDFAGSGHESGLVVRRFDANGAPVGEPVDVPFEQGDEDTWYTAGDVLVDGTGRIAIAAVRHDVGSTGPSTCERTRSSPILLNADGTLDHEVTTGHGETADHFLLAEGGGLWVTGTSESLCLRLSSRRVDSAFVQRLDTDLDLTDQDTVLPVTQAPGLTIQGPPSGPATTVSFHFAVIPGPDDKGEVAVYCGLDDDDYAPCAADTTVGPLAPGGHTMFVVVIGINGAPRFENWNWTVTEPAVASPTATPTASPTPAPTPEVVKPKAGLSRKGGKVRLRVTAAPGTKVKIAPRVKKHKLKARTFTVPASGVLRKTVKLDKRSRKLVRNAKKALKLSVKLTLTAPDGTKVVQTRTVKLPR